MAPLPEPDISFTIPSIYDDTTLDCRIYHPATLGKPLKVENGNQLRWLKRGIIMAHPYASLGGCMDDRVVETVAERFLSAGYVVGTFNFRGAQESKGRTSWSGRPEVGDYTSFAALFIHYLARIRPHPKPTQSLSGINDFRCTEPFKVILGGYSYGSLILQHIPSVETILHSFPATTPGSAASEVLLRARTLSDQSNAEWARLRSDEEQQAGRHRHNTRSTVVIGGEETSPDQRRSSKEAKRSLDKRRLRRLSGRLSRSDRPTTPTTTTAMPAPTAPAADGAVELPICKVRYLLVSPPTGAISLLLAPGLTATPKFWHRNKDPPNAEEFAKHKALIISGGKDIFSSAEKVRAWVERLQKEHGSRVKHTEVPGADHFWSGRDNESALRQAVDKWSLDLLQQNEDDACTLDCPVCCGWTC